MSGNKIVSRFISKNKDEFQSIVKNENLSFDKT